jgi:hypothetical protein
MMASMATTARLARCPAKACPVRYRGGPDRLCAEHQHGDRDMASAAAQLGIDMAALASERPGDRGSDRDSSDDGNVTDGRRRMATG